MKRNFFNRIGGALAAAVAVAGLLFGCSDIAGTGDEGGSASKGSAAASVFIPDYDALAQQVSGARAVAPQTATVRLSSAASPAAFSAVSQALSKGEKTEGTNEAGVAGYSYKFTFRIPVGEYAAGSLKVETLGSDGSALTSGVSASAVTVKAGADAATSFTLVPAAADASYKGALAAGEMQFITVTVPASSSYEVTATEGVTLFLFDASGKYSSTLTGTEIENSTEEAVTYYIGIYNAGESAIESCSVTASAAVTGASGEYKFYDKSVAQDTALSDGTSTDKAVSWSGLISNGNEYAYTSASSKITAVLGGPSIVTLTGQYSGTNGQTLTVTDSSSNKIVEGVFTSSDQTLSFIYTGTSSTTITLSWSGKAYISGLVVEDGAAAANGAANVTVTGATEITKGNSETYTATVTAKYINTDSNKYTAGTVTWAVAGSDAASITEAGVLAVADTLTEDATLTVTATCDGVSSEGYTVSATTSAKTVYELVTWAPSCFSEAGTKTGTATADLGGAAITIGGSATTYSDKTNIVVDNGGTLSIPVSAGSVLTLTHNWNARYTLNDTECKGSATYTATTAGYVLLTSLEADGGSGTTGKPAYFKKITVSNYKTTDDFTAQATGSVTSGAVTYYTVTFDSNGGTDGSTTTQKVESGVATALTKAETLGLSYDGHTFSGWATSNDSTTAAYADGASVTLTADTTLYAVWTESGTGGEATLTKYTEYFANYNTDGGTTYTELTSTEWVVPDASSTYYFKSGVTLTVGSTVDSKIAKKTATIGSYSATDCIQFGKKSKGSKITIPITASGTIKIGYTSNNTSAIRGLLATASSGTLTSRSLGTTGEIYTSTAASTAFYGDLANTAEIAVFNYTGNGGTVTLECCADASGTSAAGACYIWFIDVTDVVTLSSTTYTYSAPTVELSADTVVKDNSVTATAKIPDATVTYTYSDETKSTATEEVTATIIWSATDSSGNDASSIIDSDGKITTTEAGTYSIYASYTDGNNESQKSEAATLTVQGSSVAVTGISVYASDDKTNKANSGSVLAGSTLTLTASVSPTDATNDKVTWSSSAESIATVDSDGKVTGVAAGTATITATAADGSGVTGTYAVTVKALTTIASVAYDSATSTANATIKGTNMQLTLLTSDTSKSFSTENVGGYNSTVADEFKGPAVKSKGLKLGASALYLSITLGSYDTDGSFTASTDTFKAGDIVYITGYNSFGVSTDSSKLNGDSTLGTVSTGSAKGDYNVGAFTLPEKDSSGTAITYGNTLYLSRSTGNGTGFANVVVKRVSE